MSLARRTLLPLAIVLAAFAVSAATAAAAGNLAQLPGQLGCISESGTGGSCFDGAGLVAAKAVATSPDGRHVYVFSNASATIQTFTRDEATGALTRVPGADGCVSDPGTEGCRAVRGLTAGFDIAVSPDGRSVYTAAFSDSAIAVFARDPGTGRLTQPDGAAGCVASTVADGCTDARAVNGIRSVAVSPDGRTVYGAASVDDGVAVFTRNPDTGVLTQPAGAAGCLVENPATGDNAGCTDGRALDTTHGVDVSPDGHQVYASANGIEAVSTLDRNTDNGTISQSIETASCVSETGAGPCLDGSALTNPQTVLASPDGRHVYAAGASADSVVTLVRDAGSGRLTPVAGATGCVSETGSGCENGVALQNPNGLAISPSGQTVYVASLNSDSVVRLDRNAETGELNQPAAPAGCISEDGTGGACGDGVALDSPDDVAVAPDGANVYAVSSTSDAVVAFARGDRPVCSDVAASTAYVTAVTFQLPCADPNGEPLSFAVLSGPAVAGLGLVEATGAATYTAPAGFFGTVSFTYRVTAEDGRSGVATATVSIAGPTAPCTLVFTGTAAGETLLGTDFGDVIGGLAGGDWIEGLGGDDCLDGGDGNDRLFGDDGADTLRGRGGRDALDGGAGNDVLSGAGDRDKLSGRAGDDTLTGSSGNDSLRGWEGNDKLGGGSGKDVLDGAAGKDTLNGDSGNDVLTGGDGNDKLNGSSGNDRLTGGRGKNAYSAGSGNDDVRANNRRNEKIDCGRGRDRVRADRGDKLKGCEIVVRV
ncbi:MAG TPA: Ig-like domain-containing protein [Thermoleophilaceae bacterium]